MSQEVEIGRLRRYVAEAARVCREAASGNFEPRILHVDVDGDLGDLLHAINHLIDMADAFVREATATLTCVSEGNFYRRVIPDGMLGCYRRAAEIINAAGDKMEAQDRIVKEADARRAALSGEIQAASGILSNLSKASAEIGDISQLIGGLAMQSKLLALNASVEVGRVGEAGRGFGVVAGEVRRMAGETQEATKEIFVKVSGAQDAAARVADLVERIRVAIQSGTDATPGTNTTAGQMS